MSLRAVLKKQRNAGLYAEKQASRERTANKRFSGNATTGGAPYPSMSLPVEGGLPRRPKAGLPRAPRRRF